MMIPFLLHIRLSELTIRNLASIIETKALVPRITNNASLFLPRANTRGFTHARTHSSLHRVMYAALSASSSLGAQRVGDMSSRNGTFGFFLLIVCASRNGRVAFAVVGNDARRASFVVVG